MNLLEGSSAVGGSTTVAFLSPDDGLLLLEGAYEQAALTFAVPMAFPSVPGNVLGRGIASDGSAD